MARPLTRTVSRLEWLDLRISQYQAEAAELRARLDPSRSPDHRLTIGARVRLAGDGLRQFPDRGGDIGTVVRHTRSPGLVAVDWDDGPLHDRWTEDYLEELPPSPTEKDDGHGRG